MSLSAKMFNGYHDCGPRALCKVLTHLKHEDVKKAFLHSTDSWPHGPVNNREMNIAMRHLKVYERFEYKEYIKETKKYIDDFTKQKNTTFIILIYGHYMAVNNRIILDDAELLFNNKPIGSISVYDSWKLLQ